MLWHVLWKNKNSFSLTFIILFSTISILWQRNPFAVGFGYVGRLSDRFSGTLNTSLKLPGNLWVKLDEYRELQEKYAAAEKKLESYRLENDRFEGLKKENHRLREEMGFLPHPGFSEQKAEVLGIRINSISPRIIINKGKSDGLEPFMPVITRATDANHQMIRAVVGIIASVDSHTAIVQPINHPAFRVGVRMPVTGQWAILNGNSDRFTEASLTYIASEGSANQATYSDSNVVITPGNTVVTSGEGGIFPPGIPVGTIVQESEREGEFKTARIRLYAPISSLDYVSVIRKRPEIWKETYDREEIWDEHLLTEFGEAVYPALPFAQSAKKSASSRRTATVNSKATNGSTTDSSNKGDAASDSDEATKPLSPGVRRIQQVIVPNSGGAR